MESVLVWFRVTILALFICVCGVVAKASDECIRVTGIGFVTESSPAVRAELVSILNTANDVGDRCAHSKYSAGPTRYPWKEKLPHLTAFDLSTYLVLDGNNVTWLLDYITLGRYVESRRATKIAERPNNAVSGWLQSRGRIQSNPSTLLSLKNSQRSFGNLAGSFSLLSDLLTRFSLLLGGFGKIVSVIPATDNLVEGESAHDSQYHGEGSNPDGSVGGPPSRLLLGCLCFILGAALMKFAFYLADGPHTFGGGLSTLLDRFDGYVTSVVFKRTTFRNLALRQRWRKHRGTLVDLSTGNHHSSFSRYRSPLRCVQKCVVTPVIALQFQTIR
jgi:hypothetical protein